MCRPNADSRRKPTHSEGRRVARGLLAGVQDTSVLDLGYDSSAVAVFLAYQWLFSGAGYSTWELEDYIERSEDSPVYFDALWLIVEELGDRGEDFAFNLFMWLQDVVFAKRERPAMKPLAPHRSINSAHLERDVHVQIVVETLRRVRVSPRGKSVSGCRIVADALDVSEDAVTHIWKQRGWAESYEPMLRKHLDAIS